MGRSGISRALERQGSRSLAGEGSGGTQRGVLRHRGATFRRDGSGKAVTQEKKTLTTGVHRGAQGHQGFPSAPLCTSVSPVVKVAHRNQVVNASMLSL